MNRVQCVFRRISRTELNNIPSPLDSCTSVVLADQHRNVKIIRNFHFHNRRYHLRHLDWASVGPLAGTHHHTIGRMSSGAGAGAANRLALERSPYLLQHATNPVDWYPWGEAAFQRARAEDKLIFLSIGYSTCHWCHVMEKESFEDEAVADVMNRHFVSIKVDREERPDVDKLYMSFVQSTMGGGGWPLSVFLTPDLRPVAGGTYFPPDDRYGRPGFRTVLEGIAQQWRTRRDAILQAGQSCLSALQQAGAAPSGGRALAVPSEEVWRKGLLQFTRAFDEDYGGFSSAPKFPQPCIFNFLFHMYARQSDSEVGRRCLDMCLTTLTRMAKGGIHDHVNCGFARYSVDGRWHVPHFEKMLYDQAQLACSYTDAFVVTKDEFYGEVVHDILLYVKRDLSHAGGGFYGAEDADSLPFDGAPHKCEGAFCVWTHDELANLLEADHFAIFKHHYNVKQRGNVSSGQDPHGELKEKNVLVNFGSLEDTALKFAKSISEVKTILKECNAILYAERQKRPKPHVDTKIVTSWNGLMVSGFSKAGFVFKNQSYIDRAIEAANFIKKYLYTEEKTLLRCCYGNGDGVAQIDREISGFLDDYAFLIRGLLDLYEASLDADWLMWAESLQEQQDRLFWDDEGAGYFTCSDEDKSILIRSKEDQDGAEPCGNSVAVHNLIRLASYLHRQDLKEKAGRTLTAFSERLRAVPISLPEMMSALLFYHNSPPQVFIAGEREDSNTNALLDVVRSRFIPGRILAVADGPTGCAGLLYQRHQSIGKLKRVGGKSAAYVCRNFTCSLPVTEPEELASYFDSNDSKLE